MVFVKNFVVLFEKVSNPDTVVKKVVCEKEINNEKEDHVFKDTKEKDIFLDNKVINILKVVKIISFVSLLIEVNVINKITIITIEKVILYPYVIVKDLNVKDVDIIIYINKINLDIINLISVF